MLGGLFDRNKWGRRAPWVIVGTIFSAVFIVLAALVQQLNYQDDGLPGMYFFCNFMGNLAYSAIGIAFGACTIELFAYNEERMEVEALSVTAFILGVIIGTFYLAICLADSTYIFPIGVVVALLCFISMLGVPVMKMALSRMPPLKLSMLRLPNAYSTATQHPHTHTHTHTQGDQRYA